MSIELNYMFFFPFCPFTRTEKEIDIVECTYENLRYISRDNGEILSLFSVGNTPAK